MTGLLPTTLACRNRGGTHFGPFPRAFIALLLLGCAPRAEAQTFYDVLHSFDTTGGAHPREEPLVASGGVLYGTARQGGLTGDGVIFKINEDGTGFTVLHDFDGTHGASPWGGLVHSGGVLYGVTSGVIFKVNENGTGFTVLHNFGSIPQDGLNGTGLVTSGGVLYGTTYQGGANQRCVTGGVSGCGVVFKVNSDGSGYTKLHDFGVTDGFFPYAGLIASGGVLFGTTTDGGSGGGIFKVNEDGSGFATLHSFEGDPSGGGASGGYAPLLESGGVLFGTTVAGGAPGGYGVVFRMNKDGSGYTELHHFAETNGKWPYGGLVDSGGVLYGTTANGGAFDKGVVFKINQDGSGFTKLHDFDGAHGAATFDGLVDSGGGLYGVTESGGASNVGVIFRLYSAVFAPAKFFTLPPCRLVDTRFASSGGPNPLAGSSQKNFTVTGATCNVPSTVKAISVNVTVTQTAAPGYLTLFPGNGVAPLASSVNFSTGQTRANDAVVVLSTDGLGSLAVLNGAAGTVHFILDVNGYFQ